MKSIVRYKTIKVRTTANPGYAEQLTKMVNEAIRDGWQPLGGVAEVDHDMVQAMVQYGEMPDGAPATIEEGALNILGVEKQAKLRQYREATRLAAEFVQLMQRKGIKPTPLRKRAVNTDHKDDTESTPYVGWVLWPDKHYVVTADGQLLILKERVETIQEERGAPRGMARMYN